MRKLFAIASILALVATPAMAQRCSQYRIVLTPQLKRSEAARVGAAGYRTLPRDVDLMLGDAGWRLVWATPVGAEPGVFFFRAHKRGWRLVDVWGGILGPDRGAAIAWATEPKRGVPRRLAQCFEAVLIRRQGG